MTENELKDFISWHEARLAACHYPQEVKEELRLSRTKWMPKKNNLKGRLNGI